MQEMIPFTYEGTPNPERVSVFPVVLTEDEMMILLNALDTRLDELDSRALLTMPESEEFALGQEIDATEALRERLDGIEGVEV